MATPKHPTNLITTTAPSTQRITLTPPAFDPDIETWVCPPAGWTLDPAKGTPQHVHKTWLSPTRDTAYGVIRFKLPLPINEELALWGFLREMKKSEGDAVLLEKTPDPNLQLSYEGQGGIRFVAEGGIYRVRTNLTVRGFRGWCVYAGTLRGRAENPPELTQAVAAREATRVGTASIK